MVSPQQYLSDVRNQVDAELDRLLPLANTVPHRLHEAMRYSIFAGGKRLRPALCIKGAGLAKTACKELRRGHLSTGPSCMKRPTIHILERRI